MAEKKIVDYMIASEGNVVSLIKEWWQPFGSPIAVQEPRIDPSKYDIKKYQAMVKYEE